MTKSMQNILASGVFSRLPASSLSSALAVGFFWLIFFPLAAQDIALASMVSMSDGSFGLVCQLQNHQGLDGRDRAGKHVALEGESDNTSACRMLRVAIRLESGKVATGTAPSAAGSAVRQLGNAFDAAEYRIDVCEKTVGLIFLDKDHPYTRQMFVQAGRHWGYGQEVDYLHVRHGFVVQPSGVGERIRLLLYPWFGRISGTRAGEALSAPEVERMELATHVEVPVGRWVEFGGYFQHAVGVNGDRAVHVTGNARQQWRTWVRVDEVDDLE